MGSNSKQTKAIRKVRTKPNNEKPQEELRARSKKCRYPARIGVRIKCLILPDIPKGYRLKPEAC